MQFFLAVGSRRWFRGRGASASRRLASALAILAFAGQGLALMGAAAIQPAPAPPSPSAPPSAGLAAPSAGLAAPPAPSAAPPAPSAQPSAGLNALTVSVPTFSNVNAVHVEGAKDAGAAVLIAPLASGSPPLCSVEAGQATVWDCWVFLPNGAGIVLSATESLDGQTSAPATATIDVLGAPTIDGRPGYRTSGLVSGYGVPGASVTTLVGGSESGGCTTVAADSGYWSCALSVPSGSYVVQATQSRADIGGGASSAISGSLDIVVDRDAPASPTISSPQSGSSVSGTSAVFTGTGEDGGLIDLYLDNVPICEVAVSSGAWGCAVKAVSIGAHTALVIQRDAAGNYSTPSAPITLRFVLKAGSGSPARPSSPENPRSGPTATPLPTPIPVAPAQPPALPPPSGGAPHHHSSNWGTPTKFGTTIPTLAASITGTNWLLAPVLAAAFIVLVALPLRLLANSLRRFRMRPMQLTGRNRRRVIVPDDQKRPNTWLRAIAPVAAAAAVILLAGGVSDEVRYLRLSVAVLLGLALVNVLGVMIAAGAASRWQGVSARVRFLPLLMLAVVLAAVLSRLAGIEPPIVAGVILGIGFAGNIAARPRAIANLTAVGAVTLLACVGWLLHGMIPPTGFWGLFLGELLATVAFAGFGSAVILMLPLATLPGRAILEWSTPVWLATVAVVCVLGSVVVLGGREAVFPVLGSLLVAGAFATVSIAVWGWLRFVDPSPARA